MKRAWRYSQAELPEGRRMQTRLNHVKANVRNLQEAVEWYAKTLSFKVRSYWPPDSPDYADFLKRGRHVLCGGGGTRKFTIRDLDGNELGICRG